MYCTCALLILAATSCSALAQESSSGPTSTDMPRYAYVANEFDDTLTIYAADLTTGLMQTRGSVSTGSRPVSVTVDPSGKFVYVANSGADSISAYVINAATGGLTPVPGSP
jgi:6-phosphogluconolactonase